MADRRRNAYPQQRQYRTYDTYGTAAYQPYYDGNTVRAPRREQRPQVQPRRHVVRRPQVQVRQAGSFSPLAVAGFAVVAACAALLLIASARLMVISDQTVTLRSQLAALQAEQTALLAQRERSYDLEAIEAQLTADGTMVKPRSSQVSYLTAAEPDSAVLFREAQPQGPAALFSRLERFFSSLLS